MAIFNPIRWTTLSSMRSGHISRWFVRCSSLRLPRTESFTKLTVRGRFCTLQNRSLNSYSFVYVKLMEPRSQKNKRSYFRSCFMAYVKHLNCSTSVSARPFPELDFLHASAVTASLLEVRPHGNVLFVVYVDDLLVFVINTEMGLAKVRPSELTTTTNLGKCSRFLKASRKNAAKESFCPRKRTRNELSRTRE